MFLHGLTVRSPDAEMSCSQEHAKAAILTAIQLLFQVSSKFIVREKHNECCECPDVPELTQVKANVFPLNRVLYT